MSNKIKTNEIVKALVLMTLIWGQFTAPMMRRMGAGFMRRVMLVGVNVRHFA